MDLPPTSPKLRLPMVPTAIISETPFPIGQYSGRRGIAMANLGVIGDAGAAYLYQVEANGSATYLTKVTAPDGATGDKFRAFRFPVGQYSCLSHYADGGLSHCRGGLSLP